jgi:hypothetical protein
MHPHLLFEGLAYAAGILVYLWIRHRRGDSVSDPVRWSVVTAAVAGGAIGSKLMYLLEEPAATLAHANDAFYLMGGKSIVGGLVGGLIAVELVKRYLGEKQSTGDMFAIPLAIGIAIGRLGCFLTGLEDHTYGVPTQLPWGVDFGDGIRRHPTQIYESVLLLSLIPVLQFIIRSIARSAATRTGGDRRLSSRFELFHFQPGDAFKFFMISYMTLRLFLDAWKPYVRVALGMGSIQWTCLLVLLYYVRDIRRWVAREKSAPGQPSDTTQEAPRGAF